MSSTAISFSNDDIGDDAANFNTSAEIGLQEILGKFKPTIVPFVGCMGPYKLSLDYKGGATNLKMGGGSMHWKVGVNTLKKRKFEKVKVHDPPPPSSFGGAAPASLPGHDNA